MARSIAMTTKATSHVIKAITPPRKLPREPDAAEIKNAKKANPAAMGWRIIAFVNMLIESLWLLPNWVLTTLWRAPTAS